MSKNSFDVVFKDLNTGDDLVPRAWQVEAMRIFRKSRFMHMTVARQTGKTEFCRLLLHDFLFHYDKRKFPQAIVCAQTFGSVNRLFYGPLYKQLEDLEASGLLTLEHNKAKETAKITLRRPWLGDEAVIHFGSASSEAVGNRFRGLTIDFIILDEYAFYGSDLWNSVFSPFLDNTNGKAILTSTVKGPNFYMELGEMFADQYIDKNPKYGWLNLDIHEAKVYSARWREDRERDFVSEPWRWKQEYLNDFYAGAMAEYPLGEVLTQQPNLMVLCPDHNPQYHGVVVSVDLGSRGNMATWAAIRDFANPNLIMIHYEDDYNGIDELLADIWDRFKLYREILIIWPHDAKHSSVRDGDTQFKYIQEVCAKMRYIRIRHKVLDRSQNKLALWRETIQRSYIFRFAELNNVRRGLRKLKSFKFHRDTKTKLIEFGKVTDNGSQHAADSFAYMCESLKDIKTVTGRDGHTNRMIRQASTKNLNYRDYVGGLVYKKLG